MRMSWCLRLMQCSGCGQASRVPFLTDTLRATGVSVRRTAELCIRCQIERAVGPQQGYLARELRRRWAWAGGKEEDFPDRARPSLATVATIAKPPPRRVVFRGGVKTRRPGALPAAVYLPPPPPPPRRRPSVLLAGHTLERSGAPTILLRLGRHLRGMDLSMWYREGGDLLGDWALAGIPIRQDLDAAVRSCDVVVANTIVAWPAVAAARKYLKPVVWLVHEAGLEWGDHAEDVLELLPYARFVVYPAGFVRDHYAGLVAHQSQVIPTVIPRLPHVDRQTMRQTLGWNDKDFVIVSAGHDEPRKGRIDLVKAARRQGWWIEWLCGQADIFRQIGAADCYVASSRSECCPLTVQEAAYYSLPIVATDIPGHREVLRENVEAMYYDAGDWQGLRERLQAISGSPDRRVWLPGRCSHLPPYDGTVAAYERLIRAAAGLAHPEELNVVYHVAGMGPLWEQIIDEQLHQFADAGLRRIYCTHVGDGLGVLIDRARTLDIELVVCDHRTEVTAYERPAMELMERLARLDDRPILYCHGKGVSHHDPAAMHHDWRRLLMAMTVTRWRERVADLADNDLVGVGWWTLSDKGHIPGNIWMARADWIRRLPPIAEYWRDRFSAERWIGSVPGARVKSLLCSDVSYEARDRDLFNRLCKQVLGR